MWAKAVGAATSMAPATAQSSTLRLANLDLAPAVRISLRGRLTRSLPRVRRFYSDRASATVAGRSWAAGITPGYRAAVHTGAMAATTSSAVRSPRPR